MPKRRSQNEDKPEEIKQMKHIKTKFLRFKGTKKNGRLLKLGSRLLIKFQNNNSLLTQSIMPKSLKNTS